MFTSDSRNMDLLGMYLLPVLLFMFTNGKFRMDTLVYVHHTAYIYLGKTHVHATATKHNTPNYTLIQANGNINMDKFE